MKKCLFILFSLISFYSFGQPIIQRAGASNTVKDERLYANLNLFIPIYADSNAANINKGIDSSGAIYYDRGLKSIMYRQHSPKRWVSISSSSPLRFTSNVIVNGGAGTKLGVWENGQTIPLAGKLFDSLPYILATKCNPPTYAAPTATISASPSSGSYERGTNLGTITLTAGGSANNSGGFTGNTFYQNGSPLGSNTTTISSLTSINAFYVARTYSQGACIADNCGTIDCTGRINSGTVNSSNISLTPFDKRYYGFVNSTSPSNAQILALSQDNNGSTASLTLSNVTPSGSQFLIYLTKGTVTSVTVNGIPATGAFTITTYSVTNAQGFTSTYSYVYSNNAQTTTLSSVIFN